MVNVEKVKEIWKVLQEITTGWNYKEFEVAYLMNERLDDVITNENEITEEITNKVYDIAQSVDSLLDEYVREELDNLSREYEENEEE